MKIILNQKYKSLEKTIRDIPLTFDKKGEIINEGRNIIKTIDENGIRLNIKFFKIPNLINRLVYGNFRKSKARRSYEYAMLLLSKHINTPGPVAYIEEKKHFIFGRSYYISLQEDFDGNMRQFKWGVLQGREELLRQFARFTGDLHEKQIFHLDYSPGNILYQKEGVDHYIFSLVDLNRMRFGNISMEKGCENFQRLWGNDEMLSFIAPEYAAFRNFDIDECIKLTLKYHHKFWGKYTRKYPDKLPYAGDNL